VDTVRARGTVPDLSLEAQERLAQIREMEARNSVRFAAHEISDEEFWATIDVVRDAYEAFESGLSAPSDCPPWCNAHRYNASIAGAGQVESTHLYEVRVGEALLSIAEDDDGALEVDLHGASGMTHEQVRELAADLLAACDAAAAR